VKPVKPKPPTKLFQIGDVVTPTEPVEVCRHVAGSFPRPDRARYVTLKPGDRLTVRSQPNGDVISVEDRTGTYWAVWTGTLEPFAEGAIEWLPSLQQSR
jgi:hypothetical protein